MHIWVDADACPSDIKKILFRAAQRTHTYMTLVANRVLSVPQSPFIRTKLVSAGLDVADNKIVALLRAGDLVITADIPLAAAVIEKDAMALNPRGELYTTLTIKERLSLRNFSTALRDSGVRTGGAAPFSKRELQAFANALDRLLTKNK